MPLNAHGFAMSPAVSVLGSGDNQVGFALAVPTNGEPRAVYVNPNRGGGVVRALLAEIEARAFVLTDRVVCDASLSAVEFYKANDYRAEAAVQHDLRQGTAIPSIRMIKRRTGDAARSRGRGHADVR